MNAVRCRRCGKPMILAKSVDSGIGPSCLRKERIERAKKRNLPLFPKPHIFYSDWIKTR